MQAWAGMGSLQLPAGHLLLEIFPVENLPLPPPFRNPAGEPGDLLPGEASTSSSAFTYDSNTALASRCAAESSGKSASPALRRAVRKRWERWEMRASVSRTGFSSQDDVPLPGETLLDLLEQDAGVRLGENPVRLT